MNDEAKILMTAVVTSFFTVGVIEPVKAWLQRRRVRRWLYREMIHNCMALVMWKASVNRYPEVKERTAAQFASEYKRLAYDLAVKDAAFYALPDEEPYRIDKIYRDFELLARGVYEDTDECFLRAELAASAVLLAVKDRSLSKRVAFSVSTKQQKRYFRENLPMLMYVNYDDPPNLHERVSRRYDALQYRLWRKFRMFHKG